MMKTIRLTISAIRNNLFLNIVAVFLMSLLFFAEMGLYYYSYYKWSIIDVRNNTNFAESSYTFEFEKPLDRSRLDKMLSEYPDSIAKAEDTVISANDHSDDSSDYVCFYGGMSIIHDMRSKSLNQKFNDKKIEDGKSVGLARLSMDETVVLGGKKYNVIPDVEGLKAYGRRMFTYCLPDNEYFNVVSGAERIVFEYTGALNEHDYEDLKSYVEKSGKVVNVIKPKANTEKAAENIKSNLAFIALIALVMFLITPCILPVIQYCLSKRHYEFSSYRMCGATKMFIVRCELIQVLLLGIASVAIAAPLIYSFLNAPGFWVMCIVGIFIFLFRLLIEVFVDSKSSGNIMEVNKKWRL